MTPRIARIARIATGALALCVVLDFPAAAADFDPDAPVALTSSGRAGAFQRSLVATGPTSLAVGYIDVVGGHPRVFVRTSSDEGDHWSPRLRISKQGANVATRAALAADGQMVDVVWAAGQNCTGGPCRLWYATSDDGGQTFGDHIALEESFVSGLSQVVRQGSLVAVAWTQKHDGDILVAVSQDGGQSFSGGRRIGGTSNEPFGGNFRDGLPTVSIGHGVIYAAYFTNDHTLRVRRSIDSGDSWLPAQTISTKANGFAGASVAAGTDETTGTDDALLAYSTYNTVRSWPVSQRSVNEGTAWTPPVRIPSADGTRVPWSGYTVLERRADGRYLAAFTACTSSSCDRWVIHVMSTTDDGATWPAGYKAGSGPAAFNFPSGIVKLARVVVAYVRVKNGGRVADVLVEAAVDNTLAVAGRRPRPR